MVTANSGLTPFRQVVSVDKDGTQQGAVREGGTTLIVLGILIVGCVLRVWNINQSFWWDEIWSTMPYVKDSSLWQIVSNLGYYFNNHILYSLLARGSITILGESEFTARLPALVMGLISIVVLFQLGRRFLGTPSGITASLLLAMSAFHIDHSSEARGYSGLALFALLSSFYFLKGLKTNEFKSWVVYVVFTDLGFYSHVFMIAVSISQLCSALLFMIGEKWSSWKSDVNPKAFRDFLLALSLAGITVILIYSPILPAFFLNMGKVRFVQVSRMPFILSLLNSFFPGVQSFWGSIIYGTLFFTGMYCAFRKDRTLCLYIFVLSVLPLSLYLLMNPMFVFERYFIFALPFVLLIVSQGIVGLAGIFKGAYKNGVVIIPLLLLVYLQLPAINKMLHQDRQDYRGAVRYVENNVQGSDDAVVSIGHAGEHFRYYAAGIAIPTPQTFDELSVLMQGKKHIWCLITAWLPDIRPPHEDKALYSERPGQTEIYNYVKKNFVLKKAFSSRYPVDIYLLER
jgi:hypothetical protein